MVAEANGPATFREVFAVPEFLGLWTATVLSVAGDQLARVALSLLVYDRTGSSLLAAATYAVTFLPDLIGGSLLAGWADRFPRRRVMIGTDLVRAGLVALMAVPGTPIAVLLIILFGTQLMSVPFTAARAALLPRILEGDRFVVGTGVMAATYQVGLIVGYPLGGVVVVGLGTHGALLVDACSFVASAALIYWSVAARPAAAPSEPGSGGRPPTTWMSLTSGARLVWADPALKALLALACVSGLYIAPEGLAVPYADQIGAGTLGVGLLLAANPLGTAIGMVILSRFVTPERRLHLLGPLAIATSVMLLPTVFVPDLPAPLAWSLVWWTLAGACSAHDMVTNTQFVTRVPDYARGQAVGLAVAGLRGAQGIGVLITGAFAELVTPSRVIALSAAVGVGAAWWAARAWQRATTPSPKQRPEQR